MIESSRLLSAALAVTIGLGFSGPAMSITTYDGTYRVDINTDEGDCAKATGGTVDRVGRAHRRNERQRSAGLRTRRRGRRRLICLSPGSGCRACFGTPEGPIRTGRLVGAVAALRWPLARPTHPIIFGSASTLDLIRKGADFSGGCFSRTFNCVVAGLDPAIQASLRRSSPRMTRWDDST